MSDDSTRSSVLRCSYDNVYAKAKNLCVKGVPGLSFETDQGQTQFVPSRVVLSPETELKLSNRGPPWFSGRIGRPFSSV